MWNERYNEPGFAYGTEPNEFLAAMVSRLPSGGRVLCLAAGEGRNAVFLARQGFEVHAVDASEVGVEKTRALAAESGVVVTAQQADLRHFPLGEACWDGIISIFCHLPPDLRRDVHTRAVSALAPGGALLLEAYNRTQLTYGTGGPPVEAMLMTKEGLQDELSGLSLEHLEAVERQVVEGRYHTGLAAVVQVIGRR